MPLHYYSSVEAAKPYLSRTYPGFGGFHIADWRITAASTQIGADGGTLRSYDGKTILQFPAGAFTDTVVLTMMPAYGMPAGNLVDIGRVFDVSAVYNATGQPAALTAGKTYTATAHYDDAEPRTAIEDSLALYLWNGSAWLRQQSSVVGTDDNVIIAAPNRFGRWAILGDSWRVRLPEVSRTH